MTESIDNPNIIFNKLVIEKIYGASFVSSRHGVYHNNPKCKGDKYLGLINETIMFV